MNNSRTETILILVICKTGIVNSFERSNLEASLGSAKSNLVYSILLGKDLNRPLL